MDSHSSYELDTLLQHFAEDEKLYGAAVPPIFQNSTFVFDSLEEMNKEGANIGESNRFYSRVGNPTLDILERKIAQLEGTDRCKLIGSGMGAITVGVMSAVQQGSHVIAVDTSYGPVRHLLIDYLSRFGVTTTLVDGTCPDDIFDAIRPETSLVYLESPSSMVFRLQDLEAIAKVCREKGITTVIDNTYSTPLHQTPHKFGIDIVIHSATKYFGGHSDVVAGAVCANAERMDKINRNEVALFGSILGPFPAWLVLRGLRTLRVRLDRHEQTGNTVAEWVEDQPWVERVHHVGLRSFPQRDLFLKQMSGSGGLFSFEPKDQSKEGITTFINNLKLFRLGVSWGGFESLVVTSQTSSIGRAGSPGSPSAEPRNLVRLFTGLEDPKDLIADIAHAAEIAYGQS